MSAPVRRLRIAYVYDALHPYLLGGGERRYGELACRLAERHDVHYLTWQYWDGPPDAVRDWPFLPFLDMSPQYTVQRRALAFAGGRGIRVLTQFVPDVGFAQSGQLSYVFQGLTTDGQYYVLLTMPLALSGLAGRDDDTHLGFTLTQLDTDRAADARYEAAIDALLRKRGKELQPDLAGLDALVRSLRWEAKAAAPAAQP